MESSQLSYKLIAIVVGRYDGISRSDFLTGYSTVGIKWQRRSAPLICPGGRKRPGRLRRGPAARPARDTCMN